MNTKSITFTLVLATLFALNLEWGVYNLCTGRYGNGAFSIGIAGFMLFVELNRLTKR